MTVSRILNAKGRSVVTARTDQTLLEIGKVLADKNIGAVVVLGSDEEVLGILSERDIMRAIGRHGAAGLSEKAALHMTTMVAAAREDDSIESVMERMTAGRFRHMPVLNQGRLHGIISIGDVVKHRLDEIEGERLALREYIASA